MKKSIINFTDFKSETMLEKINGGSTPTFTSTITENGSCDSRDKISSCALENSNNILFYELNSDIFNIDIVQDNHITIDKSINSFFIGDF